MERKSVWEHYSKKDIEKMEKLCKKYRDFLDTGKTERECTTEIVRQAVAAGYRNLEELIEKKKEETTTEEDNKSDDEEIQ